MNTKRPSGFTIIELLIVIVVLAILAGMIIVSYSGVRRRAIESIAEDDLRGFSERLHISAVDNDGIFPLTAAELDALQLTINRSLLATYPTVGANALYCTASGGEDFVVLVYTSTGKKLYITNEGSGEYTGSENWNANNYPGRCANILPGSASNAIPGYNVDNPGDGWAEWTL